MRIRREEDDEDKKKKLLNQLIIYTWINTSLIKIKNFLFFLRIGW